METFGPWSTQDWPPGGVVPSGWSSNGTLSIDSDQPMVGGAALLVYATTDTDTIWVDIPVAAGETEFELWIQAAALISATLTVGEVVVATFTDFPGDGYGLYSQLSTTLPVGTKTVRLTFAFEWADTHNLLIDNFGGVERLPITLRAYITGAEIPLEDVYDYEHWWNVGLADSSDLYGEALYSSLVSPREGDFEYSTIVQGQFFETDSGSALIESPYELAIPFTTDFLAYDSFFLSVEYVGEGGEGEVLYTPLTLNVALFADTPLGTVQLGQGSVSNDTAGRKTISIDWSKLLLAPPEFWTMFNQTYEVP